MNEEKIIIKIKESGEIELETKGIIGPACVNEVNKILEKLAYPVSIHKTDEFYMEQKVRKKRNVEVRR